MFAFLKKKKLFLLLLLLLLLDLHSSRREWTKSIGLGIFTFQKEKHLKMKQKKLPTPQTLEQALQKAYEQLETDKKGIVAETQLKYVLPFKKLDKKKINKNLKQTNTHIHPQKKEKEKKTKKTSSHPKMLLKTSLRRLSGKFVFVALTARKGQRLKLKLALVRTGRPINNGKTNASGKLRRLKKPQESCFQRSFSCGSKISVRILFLK